MFPGMFKLEKSMIVFKKVHFIQLMSERGRERLAEVQKRVQTKNYLIILTKAVQDLSMLTTEYSVTVCV